MSDTGPSEEELELLIIQRTGSRHPDDYPENLYHYTSSAAFLSIVASGELWFSDFRYLNDLSELKYGVDLFRAELAARLDVETDNYSRFLLQAMRNHFEEAVLQTDQFVFCMCSENNLLNQWRVYGKDTVPLSVEFATRGFMFVNWEPNQFDLVPMVYEEAMQKRIINETISTGIEYYHKHLFAIITDKISLKKFVEMFGSVCVDWCAAMKHPQFEVEKEWRLAVRWRSGPRYMRGQKFRSTSIGIVPYLPVRPNDENLGNDLPIRSVTIGPCAYPEIQRQTIKDLLCQHNKANADVHLSNLPIRI